MRRLVFCALIAAAMTAGGCDDGNPMAGSTDPSGGADVVPPAASQPVLITSGIDGSPVASARVTIDGDELAPDATGRVYPGTTYFTNQVPNGAEIDVEAPGFLPRRTRVTPDRRVTLWPVADDAEAEAVREMVYGTGESVHEPTGTYFLLSLDTTNARVREQWLAEATEFGRPFGIRYDAYGFDDSRNALVVFFGAATGDCEPDGPLGFCRSESFGGRAFNVAFERARDPQTIRRVLAAWFLRPNPLPGLLNPHRPADDLSPLEARTIRMILQRPLPNRWPDTDR